VNPELSLIVPVFNEEAVLPLLFTRLSAALDELGRSYEVIFVDDGSADRSAALLREQFQNRPQVTRVILLAHNAGQHMAILAGFERSRGDYVVTLDADLQNPPEEIEHVVAALEEGHDYVGTVRMMRQDSWFRRSASRALNIIREKTTQVRISDQGCMLRGYARPIVDAVNRCTEVNTFVPALAYTFARRPTEIAVKHEARAAGKSAYSLYRLIRLNFDLMTGFSLVPLQAFTMTGLLIAFGSLLFVIYLAVRRLIVGPEVEGVFTLFGIVFFLIGVLLFGLGIVGEYVGRIYLQVRQRPRFVVAAVIEQAPETASVPIPRRTVP
jgi:undecaprenyl-phosphate 4-deoxy-4-formamido-L-arabinose transferase